MPAAPSTTAAIDATASSQFVASANGSATGASQVVSGVQNGANWIQPPMTESTASTVTTETIENGPSCEPCRCGTASPSLPNTMKNRRNAYRPVRNVPASPEAKRM